VRGSGRMLRERNLVVVRPACPLSPRGRQLYEGPKMNAKGKHESIRTFRSSWNRRREREKKERRKREKFYFALGPGLFRHTMKWHMVRACYARK